jgi:hypothetical protein
MDRTRAGSLCFVDIWLTLMLLGTNIRTNEEVAIKLVSNPTPKTFLAIERDVKKFLSAVALRLQLN